MSHPLEKARYVLAPPVENGNAFWEISDIKLDYPVVSISKSIPNAEGIVKEILNRLNTETW